MANTALPWSSLAVTGNAFRHFPAIRHTYFLKLKCSVSLVIKGGLNAFCSYISWRRNQGGKGCWRTP